MQMSGISRRAKNTKESMKRFLLLGAVITSVLLISRSFGAVELQTLMSFGALTEPGAGPIGPLVRGSDSDYYGMTSMGATNAAGGVFKITLGGKFTPVTSFTENIGTGL